MFITAVLSIPRVHHGCSLYLLCSLGLFSLSCLFIMAVLSVPLCRVDCVGILKLRNADVEQRIGFARSKKKSTKARLVFRVNIPNPDGGGISLTTLQVASTPILCSKWGVKWSRVFQIKHIKVPPKKNPGMVKIRSNLYILFHLE